LPKFHDFPVFRFDFPLYRLVFFKYRFVFRLSLFSVFASFEFGIAVRILRTLSLPGPGMLGWSCRVR
jgi:hypothetical protein